MEEACNCEFKNKRIVNTEKFPIIERAVIKEGDLLIPIYAEHKVKCNECDKEYKRVEKTGEHYKYCSDGVVSGV